MLIALSLFKMLASCAMLHDLQIKENNCDKFLLMLFKGQIRYQNTRIKVFNSFSMSEHLIYQKTMTSQSMLN
jgi:ABC-type hemin transport system ATPase subunit